MNKLKNPSGSCCLQDRSFNKKADPSLRDRAFIALNGKKDLMATNARLMFKFINY